MPYVRKIFIGEVSPASFSETYHSANENSLLTVGTRYLNVGGVGDLANVGEVTAKTSFVATGTTPTDWGQAFLQEVLTVPSLTTIHNTLGFAVDKPSTELSISPQGSLTTTVVSESPLFTRPNALLSASVEPKSLTEGFVRPAITTTASTAAPVKFYIDLV